MEIPRILVVYGLVIMGLLVALVALGALLLNQMKRMHETSLELATASKESQGKLQSILAPLAPVAAGLAAKAAAATLLTTGPAPTAPVKK
jgi:hypothetical protein